MLIAELAGVREFRLIEQELPEPASGEIQVRVRSVGICGSDIHYYAEGGIGDTTCSYPMVIGHEPSGEVIKTGSAVTGWQPGDRAVLEPAIFCYHCEFCMTGHHNVCAHIRFLSTPGEPGFFREAMNLPASQLFPLPKNLSYEEGTLFEPLAIVLHSLKFAAIEAGESALVFGAGPIGLLTLSMLKMCGAGRVWVAEPVAERRELARAMGADVVIDPASDDVVRIIKQDTAKRGVDLVVDCAAKGGSMNQSLFAARNAGRVVYTGIPSEATVEINQHEARRKELTLYNVRRSNHETELALRLMEKESRRFAPVLTHQRPIERIGDAFALLDGYHDGACKVTVGG